MSLGLTDDLADGIIANQIIEFAKAGERNHCEIGKTGLLRRRHVGQVGVTTI